MHSYTESRTMPFTREQMFDLVADVESYHEFLPVWLTARVVERKGNELIVDQVSGRSRWSSCHTRASGPLIISISFLVTGRFATWT